MSKKTTAIYNALSSNGDFKGSEQDFNKKFFAPGTAGYEYRKGVYSTLKQGGADVGDSYEDFGQRLGLRAVPRQQVQQEAKSQPKPTTGTPMTDAEKRAMIGTAADMVAQTGQQIAQTGRAIEHAKRHTGLDVRTPKLGQNRNVDKVQDPVSGRVQYETEDGQVYDNEAYATQAQNEYDQAKQYAGESELNRELREAKQQQADLEEALRKRREELDNGGKGFFGKMLESAAQATRPDVAMHHNSVADYEQDEEYGQLMAAVRQNRGAIQVLEDKKNNKMNSFWHSFATTAANGYTFGDGRAELNDAIALTNAQKRLAQINAKRERGEMLTREEESAEQVLTATLRNQAMQGKYGEEYGGWAIAGAGAPVSLDMMKSMLLGGGIFQDVSKGVAKGIAKAGLKQVAKASTKGLLKGASRTAAKGLVKATGVTLGSLAGGALVSNTTGLTKTLGEAAKGATGNVGIDKQGHFQFENQKGLMSALAEAERSQIGENASEMFGEFLPDIGIGKLAIRGLEKIGLSKMAGFLTSMGGKQWAKQYAQVLRASGFNGMPNEALEEYAGILYNQLTGDSDNGLKSLKDLRTHRDIWLGTATVGALMGAPNVVMAGAGAAQYYRYKHAMERAAKNAGYRLTEDKWKPLQETIDNTPNEGLTDLLMDVYGRKDMELPEKKAVYDYIHNLVKYRGYNVGTINFNDSRKAENNPKQNADMAIEGAADAAYTDGYNAQGVDMARAKREYDNATKRVVEVLGSDVVDALSQEPVLALKKLHNDRALEDDATRDAATAFVNAKMKFDGVVQRAKDDLDGMITDAHNSISQRTHQDGAIHPVTLKEDDKRAYVVDGNIAMLDDGTTIDTQNSDDTIIIRGEDGKLEFTSPSAIMSVGDLIDPAEEREMAEQTITQDFGTRRAAEIDGIDENGQSIPLGDEEVQTQAQAQAQQGQVQQQEQEQTQAQEQQSETTPTEQQEQQKEVAEEQQQDGTQPMPMVNNKDGEEEPDFMSATPQRAHQYIYNEAELPREVADEFVKNNAKAAQSHLDKVKKKQPKMGTSIAKYKAEQAAYAQEVQAAEQAVQYWDEVKAVQDAIDKQQREEVLAKQAAAAAEAKKVEEARQAQEAVKRDKQEEVIDKAVEIPKQSVQQDVTDEREDKENEPEQGVKADETTGVARGADYTLEESGERGDSGSFAKQKTEPAATGVEKAMQGNVVNNESKTEVDDSKEELKKLEDFISSTDSDKRTAINNDEYDAEELYAPLLLDGKKSNLAATINIPSRITDPSYPIALYDFEHSVNEFDWEMMENALEEYNSHVKEEDKTHMWGDSGKLAFRSVDAAVKFNDWMLAKKSKVEKHNDKQEDLMSEAERIVKENAEQGKIEPVFIKSERPIRVIEFAEKDKKKNEVRPVLSGVYHDGGYVVATDGFVLLARKEDYDKSLEGKVTDQNGNMVAIGYPKWHKLVYPANGYSTGVEINGLHAFVRGVFVRLKSKKANKRNRSTIGIAFKDANGEVRLYNANNLDKFLSGMESIGAKDIIVDASLGGLYATSARGYVVVMPTPVQNLDAGIFVYEPTSEEGKEHQKADLVTREEVEHGEKENLDKKTAKEVAEAEAETDTNPTEAQKKSGNYRKGHVRIDGMEISIEQPKGSVRRGTDDKGNKWESKMHNAYGYIRGTQSVDGDHIDVFLSDAPLHGMVYVVDQVNPETGEFDEHKVMYGFESEDAAKKAYLSNYEKGWKGLGAITEVSREDFKEWVQSSKRKTKPFAEYKSVKAGKETKGEDASSANAVLSQKEYVQKRLSEELKGSPYKTLEEWETADIEGYSEQYDNMIAEYPSYLRELAKSEKLQEIYDRSSVKEQKKIREHLEDADIDYKEVLNTSPQRTRVQDRITEPITYARGVFSDGTTVEGKVIAQTPESVTIEQNGRKYIIKVKDILEQSDEPISVGNPEFQVGEGVSSSTTDEQKLATNAVLALLESAGIPVEVVSDETAAEVTSNGFPHAEKHMVYHGSGAKFDHFDHSHMSEGEGAQAFGWGSYVTEVEGIAKSYAKTSARKSKQFTYKGQPVNTNDFNSPWRTIYVLFNNENGSLNNMRKEARRLLENIKYGDVDRAKQQIKEAIDILKDIRVGDLKYKSIPILYTVDIPTPSNGNYLEWDEDMTIEQLKLVQRHLKNLSPYLAKRYSHKLGLGEDKEVPHRDTTTHKVRDVYVFLSQLVRSYKRASEILHNAGFIGISYLAMYNRGGRNDGARNYVIFNENDLKITGHVQFMKTPQGIIYGWTIGGKVYLTQDGLNPETPIHEYTHIWADAMRRKNADGWNSVKALLKDTPVWNEVLNDPNYQDIKDDEDSVASEVISRISGKDNAKKFEEQAKKTLAETRGIEEKAQVANLISNIRRALNKFWNWVGKDLFGIKKFSSIEEVTDRVLYDLVNGTDLGEVKSDEVQFHRGKGKSEEDNIIEKAKSDGTYMKAPNGQPTNLNESQWVQVRTRAFKEWFGDWENDPKNSSKVVDENGEPKVVYHQTNSTIYRNVETGEIWDDLDWKDKQKWEKRDDWDDFWQEEDFYTFDNKNRGRVSIEMPAIFFSPTYDEYHEYGDRTIEAFLNIRNPKVDPQIKDAGATDTAGQDAMNELIQQGYDGFIRTEDGEPYEINAFTPNQVKSATENSGEFNGNDADIRFRQLNSSKSQDGLTLEDVLVPTSAVRMPRKPRHNIKAYLNGKPINRNNMLAVARQLTKGEAYSLDSNTMLRSIKGTVDFSDYYDGTIAEFKALPSDGKTVYEQWEELKAKGYEWHKSPLSNSEYLIDKETGDIYRYANHWGSVASCTWELVGAYDDYNYHIAVSNISDFKAKEYGRIAYPNVSYLQALNQSIVNVKDVLNDPSIDIKPKAREFLENILRGSERRRSELLNDNDSLIDDRNVRKKREAEPKPREEEGQVERSRETYMENKVHEMETAVTDAAAKMNLGNVVVLTSADGLDGQKKRAKGWFDRKTGKITIVLGNHTSVEDAIKTLMHEAVAHYGLRKLFGKDFDTFLENVYRNAPPSIRRKIVQITLRNGWDFRVATEEYLASLAEDTEFENAKESGWFNRIKEFFVGMMHRLIERDKLIDFGENELRYILWRSYENLKNGGIMGAAQDVVKREKLLGGTRTAGEPNILFRQIDQDKIDFDKAIARGKYEHRMRESGFQTVEAMQDSMKSLMELYKAVDEAEKVKREVEDIPDSENAYVGENRLSSVNQAELDDYNRRFFKPLLNSIGALARTDEERQDLFDYMMAKHGLERNNVMATREAQKEYEKLNQAAVDGKGTAPDWDAILDKHRKRDYSGLTTLMRGDEDEIDTATAEQRAKELVERYEEEKGKADIDNLWYDVNAANAEVLWKMYRGGLLSKETYYEIRDMYKHYIPLRGFDEETSGEEYAYLTGKNSAFTAPMKTAKGRTSKADNPIAQMALMADSAIMQANRNRLVKIPFLNYVTKHPSDLVSVSDMWLEYDEVNDMWKPKFPDISPDDTPEEVERKVGEFEDKMQQLSAQDPDKYVRQGEKSNIPYRVLGSDMREHQVIVKRNGRDYVLTINGNPRAAQAINGLTNPDNKATGSIDLIFDKIAQANRWLSAAYTTRNPDFVVSNFIRDTFYSNMMIHVKEGRNYATKFHINHAICNPVMIGKLLRKYNSGTLDMNNELQRYFYEFIMNGGETGWTAVKNAEQHKQDIKRALDKETATIPVGKTIDKIAETLDYVNRAIENSARFAAFVTSRQMGRQLGRSVYDAKEISVNFNKKGSGSKTLGATGQTWLGDASAFTSGLGRGVYTFWNASVQGLTNYMRYTKRNPAKGLTLGTALFALGLIVPYAGYLIGGGDDNNDGSGYYDVPEYVRRSNILIRAGKGWVKIPLPQEYRAVYGMGELAMTAMSGHDQMTRGEALLSMTEQLSQVLPIDFMEGGGSWTAAVPTSLKPMVEASINKGWTGLPIYKDNAFNKDDPEWTKAFKSVSGEIKGATKWLSDNTGGDDYIGGAIDLNPAQIEYVMKGMLGGYYSFTDKMVKTAKMPFGDQPVETKDIPFANRVYVYGDERTKERAINNAFYKYNKEYEQTKKLLRNYEREAEHGSEKYIEKINLMYNEPEYARYLIFEEYSKDINRLGKYRKEVQGNPEAMLEIDKQISDLRKELVHKLREVK